jgi:hypothetical protein
MCNEYMKAKVDRGSRDQSADAAALFSTGGLGR